MTTWKNLFDDACRRGEESVKKWRECEHSGGHYQDKDHEFHNPGLEMSLWILCAQDC